jgi:hypothetical protein
VPAHLSQIEHASVVGLQGQRGGRFLLGTEPGAFGVEELRPNQGAGPAPSLPEPEVVQAAYLFIGARLGLDAAPLSGFDPAQVEAAFFPGGTVRANVLCCLGYAERDPSQPRPRFDFDEVCRIV